MAPFMMLVSRTSTAPDVTHAGHSVASPAPAAAVEAALRGFAGPRWPSAARSIIFEALVKVKLPPVQVQVWSVLQLARRRPLGCQLGFVSNDTKHGAWCEFPTNGDATEPTQRSPLSRGVHPITSRCARANSISRRRRVQQTSFFQHPSGGA
jgi:hypothetical protein